MAKRVLSLRGSDDIIHKLKKDAEMSLVKEAVRINTVEMNGEAQRGAPVDTGHLRRSILMSIEDDGFSGHVNATANYAQAVNDGTRRQKAQPFMTSAFFKQKVQFEKDLKRLV